MDGAYFPSSRGQPQIPITLREGNDQVEGLLERVRVRIGGVELLAAVQNVNIAIGCCCRNAESGSSATRCTTADRGGSGGCETGRARGPVSAAAFDREDYCLLNSVLEKLLLRKWERRRCFGGWGETWGQKRTSDDYCWRSSSRLEACQRCPGNENLLHRHHLR